ncbi:MAG TPA: DUF924 family protein [Polyangiaceae bacterium]
MSASLVHPSLAYVVVLDQFSRNMFRGPARMYEGDTRALAATRHAVDRGFDRGLTRDERMFLYMPFMHSEDIAVDGSHDPRLPDGGVDGRAGGEVGPQDRIL